MGCLLAKSCKSMVKMLATNLTISPSHHLNISTSQHNTISAISAKSLTMASAPASMRLLREPLP